MYKICKQIRFLFKAIIRVVLGNLIGIFIKRDKNIFLFANRIIKDYNINKTQDLFLHNTKHLFLNLIDNNYDITPVWLCDDKKLQTELKSIGINHVYSRNSIKGIYYALKAKYWFTDFNFGNITHSCLAHNAICIDLWHGIPLKKIQFDDPNNTFNYKKFNKFVFYIWKSFRLKENYFVINGDYEREVYKSAFLADDSKLATLGSPKLNALFRDYIGQDLLMENDFANIKLLHNNGKKIIIYMPTFRETKKDISGWLKSEKLQQFLKENNAVMICKLHPYDANWLNFDDCEELYKMNNNSDIYPVLKYSDALITDYSSIYFDYLLLDKPILYYPIDLVEYQEKCRGFYRPYEELTAGVKAYNEDELIQAMQDVIGGKDEYKEQRKVLRDKMFKYQDGRNCERVVEWIKSLG